MSVVAPQAVAEEAAFVLREAWAPPCLHYTPDYVRWQLSFPGTAPALAVLAREGNEPVGFAGSTPRRVRFGDVEREVHVVSFVAVRPRWGGRGLARQLYAELLAGVRRKGLVVITFASPGTAGERVLREAYTAAGLHLRPLAPHIVYGFRPRSSHPDGPFMTSRATLSDFHDVVQGCRGGQVLWSVPSSEELGHVLRRPSPSSLLLARAPDGPDLGGAIAVTTEIVTAQGIQPSVAVETLFVPSAQPAVVHSLLTAASNAAPEGLRTVTVASLPPFDLFKPEAVGLRRTPSTFNAYVAARDAEEPLLEASATTLAVT